MHLPPIDPVLCPEPPLVSQVEWEPKGKGSRTGKSRAVPSLFRLCLNLLVENFDHIESLG